MGGGKGRILRRKDEINKGHQNLFSSQFSLELSEFGGKSVILLECYTLFFNFHAKFSAYYLY